MKNKYKKTGLLMTILLLATGFNSAAQNLEWRQMNSTINVFAQLPADPNVLFAGDQAGLIRRSTDKGANWKMVSMNSESRINDIAFLTSKKGYAVSAEPGLGQYTMDGGLTWQRLLFIDSIHPGQPFHNPVKRVVVVDSVTVFFDVFEHSGVGQAKPEAIVTRDGGKTYQLVYAPGNIYHVAGDTLLAFGRLATGYKLQVSKSIDKGKTWVLVKDAPNGLQFGIGADGIDRAIIFNSNSFILTPQKLVSNDGNIYRTVDGGNNFTLVAQPSGIGAKPDWLYFKDPMNGILLGGATQKGYHTTDGGANWTVMTGNIGMTGQWTGRLLSGGEVISQSAGRTLLSSDFGVTWTGQSDIFLIPGGAGISNWVRTVNDSVAYAFCYNSGTSPQNGLLKTTNGGVSWKKVKDNGGQQLYSNVWPMGIDTFFYSGSETGSLNLQIRYTTDNGQTYSVKYTGSYREGLKDLIIIDRMHLVAQNDPNSAQAIYTSINGGMTWTKTSQTMALVHIVCPTWNTWYGYYGNKIYKSTDQGKTWVPASGSISCLGDLAFYDEMNGFAQGCNSQTFYKTTDGGTTWTEIRSNFTTDVKYFNVSWMGFRSKHDFYIFDGSQSAKAVARTKDDGASFQYDASVQSQIKGMIVHFKDSLTGGMVGSAGQYVKYFGKKTSVADSAKYHSFVGISENAPLTSEFLLYPNPAHEAVTIELKNKVQVKSVRILDITGRIVITEKLQQLNRSFEIKTGTLEPGVYFVEVETDSSINVARVVIE